MRPNDKKVKMAIREHILEHFDWDDSPEDAFVEQIDNQYHSPYPSVAMRELLDEGYFLYLYDDVVNYLNSIGLEKYTWADVVNMPTPKRESVCDKVSRIYNDLMIREGTQMYYEIKKGVYKGYGNSQRETVSENRRRRGVSRRR